MGAISALIDQKMQNVLTQINQTLASTAQSILQIAETLTNRIVALEQAHSFIPNTEQALQSILDRLDGLERDQPKQPKKLNTYSREAELNAATYHPPPTHNV